MITRRRYMGKHDDAILTMVDVPFQFVQTGIEDVLSGKPYTILAHTKPFQGTKPSAIRIRNGEAGTAGFIIRTCTVGSAWGKGLQTYGRNKNYNWECRQDANETLEYIICIRFKQGVATYSLYYNKVKLFEESCTVVTFKNQMLQFQWGELFKVWDKDVYDRCKQEIENGKY